MIMKNGKATLVTVIIAVMLLVILVGLNRLWSPGFTGITAALGVYGFAHATLDFKRWLVKERGDEEEMSLPVFGEPVSPLSEPVVEPSVDAILDEYHVK